MLELLACIKLNVLHHHGGEALQFQRIEHGIFRSDQITRGPEAKGDALPFQIPGGRAHVALMQPPTHAFWKHVLRVERELQRALEQR